MVFREIFVGVASGVGNLLGGSFGFETSEFAAGGDGYFFCGFVAGLSG